MLEVVFLIAIGIIWIVFASVQDLKTREVANWLSFSLVVFALGFRFFYSLFSSEVLSWQSFNFFYQGLIGFGIFFVLGYLFYYSRLFAGGDAKLMIALGTVLPFSESFFVNLNIFLFFLILFLVVGSFYGLVWSFVLAFSNWKEFNKEFFKRLRRGRVLFYGMMFFGVALFCFGFFESLFFVFGAVIFFFPNFYLFAKSVDEVCMIKKIPVGKLREGDWLYENVKIGRKLIKSNWEGLSKEEIRLLKRGKKKVLIREGIAFVPVFLISFLLLVWVWFFYKVIFYFLI